MTIPNPTEAAPPQQRDVTNAAARGRLRTHNIWEIWRLFSEAMAAEGIKSRYIGAQMSDSLPHLEAFLVALDIVAYYPCSADLGEDVCVLMKNHAGACSADPADEGRAASR